MASTTFELSIARVMTPEEQEHLHKVLELIAVAHGMLISSKVVEPKLTYKIEMDRDQPPSPREWDNVGVMFCKHGRYALGDEDADNPIISYGFVDLGGYKLGFESNGSGDDDAPKDMLLYYEVLGLLKEWADELRDERNQAYDEGDADEVQLGDELALTLDAIRWLDSIPYSNESVERDDIAICLPLYLYDHSGITISHGKFSCPWDSGQVGWHYITKAKLEDEFDGDEAKAMKCLEAELKTYDDYLQGNVWGYVIENEEGDDVDSCWGFYGDELEATGILGCVAAEHVEGLKEAWERRFDR